LVVVQYSALRGAVLGVARVAKQGGRSVIARHIGVFFVGSVVVCECGTINVPRVVDVVCIQAASQHGVVIRNICPSEVVCAHCISLRGRQIQSSTLSSDVESDIRAGNPQRAARDVQAASVGGVVVADDALRHGRRCEKIKCSSICGKTVVKIGVQNTDGNIGVDSTPR